MTATVSTAPTTLPTLHARGRAMLFTEARTANTFAPTPVSDQERTLRHLGTGQMGAHAVLYSEAASFVNGTNVRVDAGSVASIG